MWTNGIQATDQNPPKALEFFDSKIYLFMKSGGKKRIFKTPCSHFNTEDYVEEPKFNSV